MPLDVRPDERVRALGNLWFLAAIARQTSGQGVSRLDGVEEGVATSYACMLFSAGACAFSRE
jgi:hypothetical protein